MLKLLVKNVLNDLNSNLESVSSMIRTKIKSALHTSQPGETIKVCGWVRTRRDSKSGFSFVELNDGSCMANLQIVLDQNVPNYEKLIKDLTTGSSLSVTGKVIESPGKNQRIELHAEAFDLYGSADAETYPLQKKRHSFEFLREIAHLRPRTNTFGAITRVRNEAATAIHRFFQSRGFVYIQTPIITTSDCEGAGEMLAQVQTEIDFSQDFFGKRASLTVSGQLEAEIFATSIGDCYTFGPTFRAENSNTTRHLAEFWMIEPEMPFYDLQDNMALAESFVRDVISDVLENCAEDMEFFNQRNLFASRIQKRLR